MKDTTGERRCKVRISLLLKVQWTIRTNEMEDFIVMSSCGESTHCFHPQPKAGDLPQRKAFNDADVCELIQNCNRAAVAGTLSRKLILLTKTSVN